MAGRISRQPGMIPTPSIGAVINAKISHRACRTFPRPTDIHPADTYLGNTAERTPPVVNEPRRYANPL